LSLELRLGLLKDSFLQFITGVWEFINDSNVLKYFAVKQSKVHVYDAYQGFN